MVHRSAIDDRQQIVSQLVNSRCKFFINRFLLIEFLGGQEAITEVYTQFAYFHRKCKFAFTSNRCPFIIRVAKKCSNCGVYDEYNLH